MTTPASTIDMSAVWHDGWSLPAEMYTSPEVLALENELVFGHSWQYFGAADTVSQPGSYLSGYCGNVPVVVTRDGAGELRALVNVCRHRGSVIATGSGCARTLTCPYHGWTYNLDGGLRGVPRFEGVIDPVSDTRLLGLRVEVWGPLLFVSADPDVEPLEQQLGHFPKAAVDTGIDIGALRLRKQETHAINANWKAIVDNALECYHCRLAHPGLKRHFDLSKYRYHYEGNTLCHTFEGDDEFVFAHLWPNSQMSLFAPALVARAILPGGADRTEVTFDYYFMDATSDEDADDAIDFFSQVVREDIVLCENVQRGLRSGSYVPGPLNVDSERSVRRFQHQLAKTLSHGKLPYRIGDDAIAI